MIFFTLIAMIITNIDNLICSFSKNYKLITGSSSTGLWKASLRQADCPPSQLALMSPSITPKSGCEHLKSICFPVFLFSSTFPLLLMPHLYYFICSWSSRRENVQFQAVRVRRGPGLRESWDPGIVFRIPFWLDPHQPRSGFAFKLRIKASSTNLKWFEISKFNRSKD